MYLLSVNIYNPYSIAVRVKENFEISLLEEMDEYSQRLNRDRRVYAQSNQRFTILRCYCHLIDQINMFSQTLGKDGKFQLFICLAARYEFKKRYIFRIHKFRSFFSFFFKRMYFHINYFTINSDYPFVKFTIIATHKINR
jgi:hypothetical protein